MKRQAFSVDLNKPLAFQVGNLGEAYEEWVHQPIVTKQSPRFFENPFIEAKMMRQAFSVDLNKPLAFQVGNLGEAYEEWVHQPIVTKQSPRFFANPFIEMFTRTPWWVVPLVWLPVVCWFVSSPTKNGVPPSHIAATMLVGVALFTLEEYSMHRFLFHMKTTSYWGNTIHYVLHGCHHKHPMDNLRLVLPPPAAALFMLMFWSIRKVVIPEPYLSGLTGGEILGYVIYDCTHYFLHHGKSSIPAFSLKLKRYHMNHHFGVHAYEKGFGVTTTLWDWLFWTLPSK